MSRTEHTDYKYATRPPLSREERDKKYAPVIDKYGKALNWLAGNSSPDEEKEDTIRKVDFFLEKTHERMEKSHEEIY